MEIIWIAGLIVLPITIGYVISDARTNRRLAKEKEAWYKERGMTYRR